MSVKLVLPAKRYEDQTFNKVYESVVAGTTQFVCDPYIPGKNQVEVWVNGQYQYPGLDFIEIAEDMIELTEPCAADDDVLIKVRR